MAILYPNPVTAPDWNPLFRLEYIPVFPTKRLIHPVLLSGFCCLLLNGCVVAALGVAGAGGYAAGQERGVGGTASDTGIKAEINALWTQTDSKILSYVDLNIFEGRVLLTGDVPDPQMRDKAVAAAWKADGVKEVINEIQVADKSTFGSNARDNLHVSELRSDLLFDSQIRSVNYSLQVVDDVVYILGVARSQEELDRVLSYARNMADIRRVVTYVRIRTGAGEPAQPAASQPAPVTYGEPATRPPSPVPVNPNPAPADEGGNYTRPDAPSPHSTVQTVPLQ